MGPVVPPEGPYSRQTPKLRAFHHAYIIASAHALPADDVLEFHAARLLLLIYLCGRNNEIDGLTKLAKLDFFVRYPTFFARACKVLGVTAGEIPSTSESQMVRHHYGPWDHRYYQVLGFLEAIALIEVAKSGASTYRFRLTAEGEKRARNLALHPAYGEQRAYMELVRKRLGKRTGSSLKALIYQVFEQEIALQPLGTPIK